MVANPHAALESSKPLRPFLENTTESTLWIGFSGGVDSTVLLHGLRHVRQAVAVHIDHGLVPEAPTWALHCSAVAVEMGVPFVHRSVKVAAAGSREGAARTARHAVWRSLVERGDVLVLAHHADDQAETRVWQLLTGREPGGMPTERPLGAGRLVRPLLGIRRRAILDYAERHGLRWIEDPSNADLTIDRNRIRHQVMPRLEARHPAAVERLAAARRSPVERLAPLPLGEADERNVEAWLLAGGLPVSATALAEIRRQSEAAPDRNPRVRIAPGVDAWRYAGAWHRVRECDRPPTRGAALFAGKDLELSTGALTWQPGVRGLPTDLALAMRFRSGGERLRADGRNVTKTVKALFQEARVPPWQRPTWPLLYAGDRLVAVPGLGVAADAAVDDGLEPRLVAPRLTRIPEERSPSRSRTMHSRCGLRE